MIRRIGMAGAAAAIAVGGLALMAGPAFAGKPVINGTGHVVCTLTGKVKISPPLSNANQLPSTTTAKTKGTCTAAGTVVQTTKGPVTVKASAAKGLSTSVGTSPGTCSGLTTPGTTPFSTVIKWKASGGKLNGSTITYPGVTPAGLGFNLLNGDTVGSFAGVDNSDAHADIALPDLAACNPGPPPKNKPGKGIKKLTITGGSLTIN